MMDAQIIDGVLYLSEGQPGDSYYGFNLDELRLVRFNYETATGGLVQIRVEIECVGIPRTYAEPPGTEPTPASMRVPTEQPRSEPVEPISRKFVL